MVSNTAYGTVGRRFNHGVAALPNNGEVILTRAEGGRKGNKLGKVPQWYQSRIDCRTKPR
mgnify:CR=1 FL=1